MANFDQAYSAYYDLLYADKDYSSEADYVHKLVQKFGIDGSRTLLDIGCGTGKHAAALAEKGYCVCGIDRSVEMIEKAKILSANKESLSFQVASADDFSFLNRFDVVTSLFHVISYLTGNEVLFNCFKRVFDALNENGVFIFDFWYGPAVFAQKPENRIKILENDSCKIHRFAHPEEDSCRNIVTVKYNMICIDKNTNFSASFSEDHPMRYFFLPELQFMLGQCGFSEIVFEEFLTGADPSPDTWGVCCIAKK